MITAEAAQERLMMAARPSPPMSVSEFAETSLIIPTGPTAGQRWRFDDSPYQRGILDAFDEPGIEVVVVMGASQWGKTTCALALIAYHIVHDPCPILAIEPTVYPMAEDLSKNRIDPMIRRVPELSERVDKKRAPGASNTTFLKTFRGGLLAIGGANSAASLAARSIRVLVPDEVDRYPAELPGEGNTLEVALKRTAAYNERRRVFMASSPTIVGAPIHAWFKKGDQRYFHVPCPDCGVMRAYEWANVRWEGGDAATARIVCPDCEHEMSNAERVVALRDGEWCTTSEPEDPRVASFHISELYSPFTRLSSSVSNFIAARAARKAGDDSLMHTWQNTTLGQPIELEAGEGLDADPLLLRREDYGDCDIPARGCFLTMGVDTQDDRLELLVVAWGPGEESWIVERDTLPGDPANPEVWETLDEFLDYEYAHESGERIPIYATCIDSAGHRTDHVYDYVHRRGARRVYATVGRDGNRPIISSPSQPRKRARGGRKCPLYVVGVDAAKALLMSRLRKEAPEEDGETWDGYVHIPMAEWADEELAAQLTSERLVTRWRKGHPVTYWKKTRARNEMLDCFVLNIAALRRSRPDLDLVAERLRNPKPPPKPRESSGHIPRRRGWLKKR